jgi:tetratricopeptide (TPR) repeat protein
MIDPENDSLRYALSGVYINAGNKFFSSNKLDEARVCYLNSITVDSTASKAFNNLGSVYAQEGKLDTAIILYTKAIALDSLYTEAYYNLGNVNLDQHNEKKGIEFIKRAARLGNPQAQEFLKRRGEKW